VPKLSPASGFQFPASNIPTRHAAEPQFHPWQMLWNLQTGFSPSVKCCINDSPNGYVPLVGAGRRYNASPRGRKEELQCQVL